MLPGLQIHALLEGALKAARALPASIVVERAFGMLELHHEDKGEVIEGGQAVLDSIGLTQEDRITPRIVSNTIFAWDRTHARDDRQQDSIWFYD